MPLLQWTLRCVPGLSVILLLILIECALQILQTGWLSLTLPTGLIKRSNPVIAQALFLSYSIFIHILAMIFPLRLCHAAWSAAVQIEAVYGKDPMYAVETKEKVEDDVISRTESHETLDDHVNVIQAIMIPSYKEEIGVLEDTLRVLASHQLARKSYDIFLAMEGRDPNGPPTASKLIQIFEHRFHDIQFTVHPADIDGEAPGKSSNISWAAREVQKKYIGKPDWKDVMMTVMDSDTHLLSDYFKMVRARHLVNRKAGDMTDMTLYMPPIVFDRNAHRVPRLVRAADLMWSGAGLSCFQSEPTRFGVGIPTSVYTVTLPLVCLSQGWDTGPGAIGEDLHMMLKCYFATNGKLLIESIPSPASQCNITTEKRGFRGWVANHRARYTQGLRHMWGCLDSGYAATQWLNMGSQASSGTERTLPRQRKLSHTELELKLSQYQLHGTGAIKLTWRNAILFSRLYEAHFLPIHLMIILLASTIYTDFSTPIVHCRLLYLALDFMAVIRAASFLIMMCYFTFFYERFHAVCVNAREAEMRRAGLYEDLKDDFNHRERRSLATYLDYIVFPVAGMIFGSVPLIHAAFAHFWSERLVYTVSAKPSRARALELVSEKMDQAV